MPTVDTSTFRVASRVIPLPGETREITRPAPTIGRRRSRRRLVVGGILAGIVLLALVAALVVVLISLSSGTLDQGATAALPSVASILLDAASGASANGAE